MAAGALDFSDGLRLVLERGRIMAERVRARPGGMATILGMEAGAVRDLCRDASPEGNVRAAVFNGPGHTVISGDVGPLQRAMQLAREAYGAHLEEGFLERLAPARSNTPIMQDASRELSQVISVMPFRDPEPPLVSNISANLLTRADEVRQELSDQLGAAVQWARCVLAMANEGAGTFAEVAPGKALSKMVRRITSDAEAIAIEDASDAELLRLSDRMRSPIAATLDPAR